MSPRLAIHLAPHQLPDFQRAARILLGTPLVTDADPERFSLIRRWESVLRNEFAQKLGYRLDVSRSAARLLRRPSSLTRSRGARTSTGRHLTRWGYTYFALALAALEKPRQQILAAELLREINDLVPPDSGILLNQTEHAQRRGLSDALGLLVSLGVLTERDGRLDRLMRDEEVLFDIDRDAAALCLVASPSVLREVEQVADFLVETESTSAEARSRVARQLLNRRLIDQPIVVLDDLSADEQELAWRNRRREADNMSRLTGCAVEVRAEGMALIDAVVQPISRTPFPGRGSTAHAALLWLDLLLATRADMEDSIDCLVVDAKVVGAKWGEVLERYGSRFNKDARTKPEAFRQEVEALLADFGLLSEMTDADGSRRWSVPAAAARYRADVRLADAAEGGAEPTEPVEVGEATLW